MIYYNFFTFFLDKRTKKTKNLVQKLVKQRFFVHIYYCYKIDGELLDLPPFN